MKIFALSCVPYRRHTGALHLRLFFVVVGKMHFCVWLLVCREVQGAPMGAKKKTDQQEIFVGLKC